ncbi:MAG TPA: hypothetical protein VFX59_14425 [Polyangiales bacterium]|nr:hypothetical protein [Polyangiales bacterium]
MTDSALKPKLSRREALQRRADKLAANKAAIDEQLAAEELRRKSDLDKRRTRIFILLGAQVAALGKQDPALLRRMESTALNFHRKLADRVLLGLSTEGEEGRTGASTLSVFEKIRRTGDPVAELESYEGDGLLDDLKDVLDPAPARDGAAKKPNQSGAAATRAATSGPSVAASGSHAPVTSGAPTTSSVVGNGSAAAKNGATSGTLQAVDRATS